MKSPLKFFDRLEDNVRGALSRAPLVYALIGGVAVVLFWRSVWMIADEIPFLSDPYVSLIVSAIILLSTGLFVSFFIGDSILLSGIKGEKKIVEKTEEEIKKEGAVLTNIQNEMKKEEAILAEIQRELAALNNSSEKNPPK